MPGPCNSKKKRQQQAKKEKLLKAKREALTDITSVGARSNEGHPPDSVDDHSDQRACHDEPAVKASSDEDASTNEVTPVVPRETMQPTTETILQQPFITDPGNGPRVKDVSAYLSSFFCIPPDPACAAFAAPGVLEMLLLALPREVAIVRARTVLPFIQLIIICVVLKITWFNRTRRTGRICPACQRIYKLGDTLLDPVSNMPMDPYDPSTPKHMFREQKISGICKPSLPSFRATFRSTGRRDANFDAP